MGKRIYGKMHRMLHEDRMKNSILFRRNWCNKNASAKLLNNNEP